MQQVSKLDECEEELNLSPYLQRNYVCLWILFDLRVQQTIV